MNEGEIPGAKDKDAREASRSRWFFIVFFAALFLSVAAPFYRTFVARDYFVLIETACDPSESACFARDICETEDGVCAEGDTLVETEYYKIVERKAFAFPEACATGSLEAEECADLSCRPDEPECSETFCSEEVVPEGETCLGPGAVIETKDSGDADSESGESAEVSKDSILPVEDSADEGIPGEEGRSVDNAGEEVAP